MKCSPWHVMSAVMERYWLKLGFSITVALPRGRAVGPDVVWGR